MKSWKPICQSSDWKCPKKKTIKFLKVRKKFSKSKIINKLKTSGFLSINRETLLNLCRGPHVGSTGQVKALKLLTSAGAYWRGDERNPMLQRIYGTSFPSQFSIPNRQIPVASQMAFIHHDMERAIHGLKLIFAGFHCHGGKHIVLVIFNMSAGFP